MFSFISHTIIVKPVNQKGAMLETKNIYLFVYLNLCDSWGKVQQCVTPSTLCLDRHRGFCGGFFFYILFFFPQTLLLGKLDMQMPEYTKTTFNWTHLPTSWTQLGLFHWRLLLLKDGGGGSVILTRLQIIFFPLEVQRCHEPSLEAFYYV